MDTSKNPPYMFSSPRVDYFFRWHWWSAPLVFLPISALLFGFALSQVDAGQVILLMIAGGLLWTLFEYCMHRFLFHLPGNSRAMKHFHYIVHGMHHAHSTDPLRVIFPPFLSIFTGILVGGILFLLFPIPVALGLYAGFILGYIWYEFIHYADHHIKWKVSLLKRLKRHHLLHHHSTAYKGKNFGVTTSLWDKVFKTFMP